MTTPAGWYPDPNQPTSQRYWDGQNWTEHTSTTTSGVPVANMGRSEDDVTRAVAAVMERHSKINPDAAKSRCGGGEVRCALPMDAEAFTRHQARAIVEEVLFPALDSFAMQTHLVSETLERIGQLGSPAVQNAAQHMGNAGPSLMRHTEPKEGGVLRWWKLGLWAVFVFVVLAILILNGLLDAFSS
ncbi:MAG: DUF2510 domain-containing protein [Actinomycetes bacterium]